MDQVRYRDREAALEAVKVDLALLEQEALSNRPELREQDYQTRITATETRKAMLRLLPGLEFSVGGHYDSNSFLVEQGWAEGQWVSGRIASGK